jgi:DNA-binding response OmpR family regulator
MVRILLIEPDTYLARLYAEALKQADYKIDVASGAQMAITMADHHTPDLIILEIQLAQHNGLEFLYEFRSYKEWQDIPVLLHTLVPPADFNENIVLWNEIELVGYLYKPRTSLKQLLRSVAACTPSPVVVSGV